MTEYLLLVLAMLLQSVPIGADKSDPSLPRMLDLAGTVCEIDACDHDPARRYRLETERVEIDDTMKRAMRGVWQPCETTGAPACPSKGREIVRAEIEHN